jgi:hypothetical protein
MTTVITPVWAPWTTYCDPASQGPSLSPSVSVGGDVAAFGLNDFILSLVGGQDVPLAGATALSGAVSVDVPSDYNLEGFLLVVRGVIDATARTEAVVSCSIGHSTHFLQWPPPANAEPDRSGSRPATTATDRSGSQADADPHPITSWDFGLECFTSDQRPGAQGVSNSPLPPLPITLSMQGRRRTADENISIDLQSFTVTLLGFS